MRLPGYRRSALFLLALAALAAAGCKTLDRPIEDGIGTVVVYFGEPSLGIQQLNSDLLSAVEWTVNDARIILDGQVVDMDRNPAVPPTNPVLGCVWADTAFNAFPARSSSACASGTIFPIDIQASQIDIELELSVQVYRTEPFTLDPMGNDDGDSFLNEDDNCPLVDNEPQFDGDDNGIGDDCELFQPTPILDSDGDGDSDFVDRCAWVSNTGATIAPTMTAVLMADTGTGDVTNVSVTSRECRSQVANLQSAGSSTVTISRSIVDFFRVSSLDTTNLVVDLDLENNLSNCNWGTPTTPGECAIDPAAVKICVRRGAFAALAGCPN